MKARGDANPTICKGLDKHVLSLLPPDGSAVTLGHLVVGTMQHVSETDASAFYAEYGRSHRLSGRDTPTAELRASTGRQQLIRQRIAHHVASGRVKIEGEGLAARVFLVVSDQPPAATRAVADLKPHPENARIYGDGADASLVESVRLKKVLSPLLITWDGRVISGHRRLAAAKAAGLTDVPVVVYASRDELDILEALVHDNRTRQKTGEQLRREATVLQEVEGERARLRMEAGKSEAGGGGRGNKNPQANSPEGFGAGQARAKVAEALGIGQKQVDQLAAITKKINELEAAGNQEEVAKITTALNERSVNAAYKIAVPPPPKKPPRNATPALLHAAAPPGPGPDPPKPEPPAATVPQHPSHGGLVALVAAWNAATWQARDEFDAMRERGEL
jgi:ParB-like chromosome segregation protein Spo0J